MGLVIGYARVSSDEQAQGRSLEHQIMRLKNAGCSEIFTEVKSGFNGEPRPKYNSFLELIAQGDVAKVYITEFDRLGRDEVVLFSFFNLCDRHNIKLICLEQPYIDISTPEGREMAGHEVVRARSYSAKLSKRVKSGHKAHRDRNAPYFAAFGYRKVFLHKKKFGEIQKFEMRPFWLDGEIEETFELDYRPFVCLLETKQELTVYDIAREYINSLLAYGSIRKTIRLINEKYGLRYFVDDRGKGNRKCRGAMGFSVAGFGTWLNNPMLAGHLCYGRTSKQGIKHSHNWDIRYNQFSALISDIERREIVNLLKHNAETGGRVFVSEFVFPVSGLVYCGECRGKCRVIRVGRPKNFSFSYQCINYSRARSCTQKTTVKEKTIIEAVIDSLIQKAKEIAALAATPTKKIEPPELQQLRSQLAGLQTLGTNMAIASAIAELKRQIQDFEAQLDELEEYQTVDRSLLISVFSDPIYFKSLSQENQRRVFHGLVEKVLVRQGAIVEIRLKV